MPAQAWDRVARDFTIISLAAVLLTVIMGMAGWACRLAVEDRFALAVVLVVRNVAVATAVAVTVLNRTEFAVLVTACFLNQAPILLSALVPFRLMRRPQFRPNEGNRS